MNQSPIPSLIKAFFTKAVDRLVQYDRPYAAIRCIERLIHEKQPINSQQAVRVLQAVLNSSEGTHAMDVHAILDVIKSLQEDPGTEPDELFRIEWAFLPLLDRHHGASPKLLEQRLASNPAFFCEVIRTVFRSKKDESPGLVDLRMIYIPFEGDFNK